MKLKYNVRGLGNFSKRREIFHYLHTKDFNVIHLQETHSVKYMEKLWKSQWGSRIYFSHGQSNARGTAILVKRNVNVIVHNVFTDLDGRMIILDITHGKSRISLANIYAPNSASPIFFQELDKKLLDIGNDLKIVAGDFNLILDKNLDQKGGQGNTKDPARVRHEAPS